MHNVHNNVPHFKGINPDKRLFLHSANLHVFQLLKDHIPIHNNMKQWAYVE